jgi:hypothetical protein
MWFGLSGESLTFRGTIVPNPAAGFELVGGRITVALSDLDWAVAAYAEPREAPAELVREMGAAFVCLLELSWPSGERLALFEYRD